ncbi:hypothetical protein ACFYZ9_02465 [Streptomyces sp. NPDC001691]|nr:hypothetical protein [Streptomyces sp. SDr-06]
MTNPAATLIGLARDGLARRGRRTLARSARLAQVTTDFVTPGGAV